MMLDYSVTPPVKAIQSHYQPYPPHLDNYNRIYKNSTEKAENKQFEGRPFKEFLRFLDKLGIGAGCHA